MKYIDGKEERDENTPDHGDSTWWYELRSVYAWQGAQNPFPAFSWRLDEGK
jgi:hypothetical protein